jgi:hypothetical protein
VAWARPSADSASLGGDLAAEQDQRQQADDDDGDRSRRRFGQPLVAGQAIDLRRQSVEVERGA